MFDFGLARELHCSDDNDNSKDNDIYSMSSEVGSLRYMAPEVANGQKYNHKVDVYAFGKFFNATLCRYERILYIISDINSNCSLFR